MALASRYLGVAEKPLHEPASSRSRNRCQAMPLRPATYSTGSRPLSRSLSRSWADSRSTLEL
jgi:hypothetical protein